MNEEMSYEEAVVKLQQIIVDLQDDKLPIDDLINKASEAKELVEYCRQKLRTTEKKLNGLIDQSDE